MNLYADWHIEHPFYLFAMLLIPAIFLLRMWLLRKSTVALPTLQYGLTATDKLKARAGFFSVPLVEILVLVIVFLAAAGVHRRTELTLIGEEGLDIGLALDISASMQADDFKPNRLEALKEISADFIKRAGANRIAVYVFAGDVFTQTPMTTDHPVLLHLLGGISYEMIDHAESGGTAIGDAMLMAADNMNKLKEKDRDQVLILITDGENSHGIDPLVVARHLREKNIRLYIIGLGGDEPVEVYVNGKPFITVANTILKTSLDDTQLKEIAKEAGGKYYRAKSKAVLGTIFDELARLEKTPIKTEKQTVKQFFSDSLAIAAFMLLMLWLALRNFFHRRPLR